MQPWTPRKHQKIAIKFGVSQGSAGYFMDPGLGKTSTSMAVFKILKSKGLVNRALVIAPLRPATSVWPREVLKWTDFSGLKLVVLHGPKKDALLASDYDIAVINPEGLDWLFSSVNPRKWPWQMLIVDESTRFKHPNTHRFKVLKAHLKFFKRHYILTGTPAPNGLMDLFGQIYILDQGAALGRYITHFRNSFFDSTGFGGYTWKLKEGAEELIYEKLRPLVIRMSAEDYLDLPPLVFNTVDVELPPAARRIYDQMEDLMLAEVNDNIITAANAASATQKCRQIANGGLYHEGGKTWEHVHSAKIEAVQELVEELSGKPALVAYEFKHDLDRLQKAFPDAPYLGGGVTTKQQRAVEDAWNAGELPVLFAQPQSVAHGLNLQEVNAAVIFHSMIWNLEDYDQLIRRIWRQGQKARVVVHNVVANKTVDQAVMSALHGKDKVQRALLDALKDYAANRR